MLSYAFLGREYVTALLLGREPIMVGEGADFFSVAVPDVLVGGDLGSSQIGAKTGLIVIAIERNENTNTNPSPGTILEKEARLLMLGTIEQRDLFAKEFA